MVRKAKTGATAAAGGDTTALPTQPAQQAAAPVTAKNATKAHVMKNGEVVRTYDVDTHGEDFHDLAKEFSSHTAGTDVSLA